MGNLSVENVWHDCWDFISQQNIGKRFTVYFNSHHYMGINE